MNTINREKLNQITINRDPQLIQQIKVDIGKIRLKALHLKGAKGIKLHAEANELEEGLKLALTKNTFNSKLEKV